MSNSSVATWYMKWRLDWRAGNESFYGNAELAKDKYFLVTLSQDQLGRLKRYMEDPDCDRTGYMLYEYLKKMTDGAGVTTSAS